MSMRNLRQEAEEARRALGELDAAAERRRRAIARERDGLSKERRRVVGGARLAMRDIDDHDEMLEEEEQQLTPHASPTPTPEPEPRPEPPTPVVDDPVPTPVATPVVVTGGANPCNWDWLVWLYAFIGMIIGLIVASATFRLFDIHGFGHGIFTVAWFIALMGVGFFGGGLIGHLLEKRRQD